MTDAREMIRFYCTGDGSGMLADAYTVNGMWNSILSVYFPAGSNMWLTAPNVSAAGTDIPADLVTYGWIEGPTKVSARIRLVSVNKPSGSPGGWDELAYGIVTRWT
ncbi:hypothetical protein PIIN_05884 [Serendipita indica DSM 11827]|uniref:Uncharacterized protein n=1 Tax=Serendipita indica (strain DSM 11827) TaxID=1109443 RepID=G4TKV6_SERID|nr:hypothetical protein PIIN_05884 [Serendipita indica DSM 11827]